MTTLQDLADSYAQRLVKAEEDGNGLEVCRDILKEIDSLAWEETKQSLSPEEKRDLIRRIGTGRRLIKKAEDNRALLNYISYMLSQAQDRKK